MMTTRLSDHRTTALRRAAVSATLAHSVHNTQPWRLRLDDDRLGIYADRSRRLHVLDPSARQLTMSCGSALMNARVSLASDGVAVRVARMPDPTDPDLLAVLTLDHTGVDPEPDTAELGALDTALELRQTNRHGSADDQVPATLLDNLEMATAAEGASLHVVRDPDRRVAVATLSQHAEDIENLNPAYRAELRAWTIGQPAPPRRDAARNRDPLVQRTMLRLVCTSGDSRADWLRAGEALERVLLVVTWHGFTASALTQVTEVPSVRAQLRRQLGLVTYPQVLLRIGSAEPTPGSRRRRLVDMLVEDI